MAKKIGDKLDDLNLTNDEVKRLSECMKDQTFMELLKDYAMEISDPENKKKYEEEIAMMEGERGNDVKFVNPTAGYVLKTTCNGKEKCFLNICTSAEVGKPSCKPSVQNSSKGMNWSIPHSVSQPRDDTDKSSRKCIVYDVVFHPDTCHMAEKNSRFRQMIENIALDAIERNFSVSLDKTNVRRPKMKYKGVPQSSIIRVPKKDAKPSTIPQDPNDPLAFPYPPMSNGNDKSKNSEKSKHSQNSTPTPHDVGIKVNTKEEFVEPKYDLVHRGYFDIKNYYAMSDQTVASTRPRELVLNVELPLLKSAELLELEISKNRVYLECTKPVKYKLDLNLPFPVDDTKGCAKFEKSKKRLIVTLEVLPPVLQKYTINPKGEKCLESDNSKDHEHAKCGRTAQLDAVNDEKAPSSHPSGLIHMHSKCRHENHGLSWGKPDEDNSDNVESPPLSLFSPSLIKILLDENQSDQNCAVLKKIRPQLSFHQDDQFVVFIINVKNIDSDKLWYTVTASDLKFSCKADGISDEIYQLYISFNTEDKVDPQRSRVDISDDNAVFALRKRPKCLYEWQNFEAGFDEENRIKKCFLTQNNLENLLSKVQEDINNSKYESLEYQVISESKNPKMLALKLSPKDREKLKLSREEGSNSDVNDLLEILKQLDGLDNQNNAGVQINSDTTPAPEHEKQSRQGGADTDEDDSSATDSVESDKEAEKVDELEEIEPPCDTSVMKEISGNSQQESHEQLTSVPTPANKSQDSDEVVDGMCDRYPHDMRNEALIVHEHEKGNNVNSHVYTDHKTKSVVTLNNEMLFEIDSD